MKLADKIATQMRIIFYCPSCRAEHASKYAAKKCQHKGNTDGRNT